MSFPRTTLRLASLSTLPRARIHSSLYRLSHTCIVQTGVASISKRPMSSSSQPPDTMAKGASSQPATEEHKWDFELSPVPPNPLGEGKYIRTAGCLIIGSNYFAKFCFELGIDLKRIEVIADDEDEIVEASRRMVEKYDFVITSGGIGPTHDDITYASLAKAFNQDLVHHQETLRRMAEMSKSRPWIATQNEEQRTARERMALFPKNAEALFVAEDIWVPVVRLEGKLCIFPGIPRLYTKMLDGLTPYLPLPPPSERPSRLQVFTTLPESSIAPYLTELHNRVKNEGIRVGSYPLLRQGVYVSLIGLDAKRIKEIGDEVVVQLQGKVMTDEEIAKAKAERSAL